MKQYGNKEEKPNVSLKPVLLWQEAGIEQGDSGDTGQSAIWIKQKWKHAKQAGSEICHNIKLKTHRGFDLPRSQTVQREIRLNEDGSLYYGVQS